MRHTVYALGLLGHWATLGACSSTSEPAEPDVGSVEQAAELDSHTIFPIVDLSTGLVLVNSHSSNASVKISYLGDKTTPTGHTVMAPALVTTLSLSPFETKSHTLNLSHSAFTGGYGAVRLENSSGSAQWQSWLQATQALHSTSGNVFSEGAYRVPYVSGTNSVVLAVTNLNQSTATVEFTNLAPTFEDYSISVYGLSTFRFDTVVQGWTTSSGGAVDVRIVSGTIAMSGYVQKGSARYRTHPVAL